MALSTLSLERLETVDPELSLVFIELSKFVEFRVTCGHRNEAEQTALFQAGKSKKPWPLGKHNRHPSEAVDAIPFGGREVIEWKDYGRFSFFAGQVCLIGQQMGVKIRWGGDWDSDRSQLDEKGLRDLVHFEIIHSKGGAV